MNGNRLLVTNSKVFEFNNDYIVPASYIINYPNLKYYLPQLPKIQCKAHTVFVYSMSGKNIEKFPTNFNGMIIEHVINTMLNVHKIDSTEVLTANKSRLNYLGKLPSAIDMIPMIFNPDGSMTSIRPQDKAIENTMNAVVKVLKRGLKPLVDYIAKTIFENDTIKSQELVVHRDQKVLALCDLSSDKASLEIKTTSANTIQSLAEQLYYESNGRLCYILQTDWKHFPVQIDFTISQITFDVMCAIDRRQAQFDAARNKLEFEAIQLTSYTDAKSPVKLKCNICGNEWTTSYKVALNHAPCPYCRKEKKENFEYKKVHSKRKKISPIQDEEKKARKIANFQEKLNNRSNNSILVLDFIDSRSPAKAKCKICGYEWSTRADHLLDRSHCPKCKCNK